MLSTKQKAGDGSKQQQAGDHANQYQIDHHYYQQQTTLERILHQLKLELDQKVTTSEINEDFARLMHFKTSGEFIGLMEKLKAGQRLDLLEEAEELKERVAKKITRAENIDSAQKLYIYLLEDVITAFKYKILPLIKENKDNAIVDSAIKSNIIDPISEKLGINPLNLFPRDIEGLLYFLIGNCHLKWG